MYFRVQQPEEQANLKNNMFLQGNLKRQIVGKSTNIKGGKHKKISNDNSTPHQANIMFSNPNSKKPNSIMLNKHQYMESPMKNIVVNPK